MKKMNDSGTGVDKNYYQIKENRYNDNTNIT